MSKSNIKAGSSYVELLLKKSRFVKGLRAAGRQLKSFSKAAVVAGAAVAAGAIGGVALAVRQYVKMGDTLDKMSKRTGVSVESLSELQHAAELSGTSLQTVEKGIRGMQRGLVDAERGLSTATDNLNDLGLSLEDLQGLSPEKQFDLFADRISAIKDPSRQAALAMKVFGKAGADLIPMMSGGSAGIAEMRKAARDAGITMSTDMAGGAARLLDGFTQLWATIKRFAIGLGGVFAPFLESALPMIQTFATQAVKATSMAGDFIKQAWEAVYNYVAPILGGLWTVFSQIFGGIWEVVQGVWGSVSESTGSVMSWMQDVIMGALSVISYTFDNWGTVLDVAMTSAAFSIVRFVNQTVHLFGTVLPAWLSWFGDNWRDVFTDIVNLTEAFAVNIWKNISNLWDGIIGLFSGDGFTFEWTPLTDGFTSAIKELPKIAEREMGPLEKQLNDDLNQLANKMVGDFEKHSVKFQASVQKFTPTAIAMAAVDSAKAKGKQREEEIVEAANGGGARSKEVISSFSLAALAGQVGGSGEDKVVKAVDDADKKQAKRDRKMIAAIERGAVLGK